MKNIILFAAVMLFTFTFAGIAFAAPPSVINTDTGASVWSYQDSKDTTAKPEGAYKSFDDTTTIPPNRGLSAPPGLYTTNPHGGYDSGTNKCKVCHAVHRAEGAYYLLRADTQDDVCDYCHIGAGAHSNTVVYDLNPAGTATPNGHTIGSSSIIPDSSVSEWTIDTTLTTTDASGTPISEVIPIRAYAPNRNKMFRFAKHHGHVGAGSDSDGYTRIGPLTLRCMSCNQQHAAKNMMWRPPDADSGTQLANGYKLLRLSPSASIEGTASVEGHLVDYDQGMQNYAVYGDYDPANGKFLVSANNIVKVPETDMSSANTGSGHTIYTTFTGVAPSQQQGAGYDPQTVNQYTLSPWCADCHNLDIGYEKRLTHQELGFKSHTDRTHPVPYEGAGMGPGQCYSCHRNDLPDKGTPGLPSGFFSLHKWVSGSPSCTTCHSMHGPGPFVPTEGNCAECHFGPGHYKAYKGNIDSNNTHTDFPHSGQDNSIKLLGPVTKQMNADDSITYGIGVTEDNVDGICLRCHTGIGTNH